MVFGDRVCSLLAVCAILAETTHRFYAHERTERLGASARSLVEIGSEIGKELIFFLLLSFTSLRPVPQNIAKIHVSHLPKKFGV